MKTEVKEISSVIRELTIIVEAERALLDFQKELNKMRPYAQVPGFRKGKAPIAMVERLYGDYAKDEFLTKKIETYYQEALKTIEEKPVCEANTENVEWEKGKDLKVVFRFEVMPKIVITQYKNLEIPYEEKAYENSMLEQHIKQMQNQMATTYHPEQLEIGDSIEIKISSADQNGNFEEDQTRNTYFIEGEFSSVFYKNFMHAKVGTELKTVLFSHDELSEDMKKEAILDFGDDCFDKEFMVKLVSMERNIEPEINDELAKDLEFDSLDDLKATVEKEIKEKLKKENDNQLRGAIIDKLLKVNPFELPETYVLRYTEALAKPYATAYKTTVENLVPIYKAVAEYNLKSFYLMQELRKLEPVEITEEDKEELITEAAENLKISVEKYKELHKKEIDSEDFIEPIIEKKLLDIVKSTAVIIPYPQPIEELQSEQPLEIIDKQ